MSTGAGLAGYFREQTPSGVWIEYNLDNPDSPPHIIWPTVEPYPDDEDVDDEAGPIDTVDEEVSDGQGSWGYVAAESVKSEDENQTDDEDEDTMDGEEESVQTLESSGWGVRTEENSAVSKEMEEKMQVETQKNTDTGGELTEEDSAADKETEERLQGASQKNLETGGEVTEDSVGHFTDLYYNPQTGGESVPAIYHHEIRQELIRAASTRGQYAHPQPRGPRPGDETSFLEEQRNWGIQRANYPPITFEYRRLNRRDPEYEVEHWYHRGRLVLDCEGIPVRRFINIPDVLSSEYPGHFMEANRRQDSRIQNRDFAARMPPLRTGRTLNGQVTMEFPKTANTLSSRRRRFRLKAGCLTWNNRPCQGMTRFLEEHLPQDLKDRNTTNGFRDLTPDEILEL